MKRVSIDVTKIDKSALHAGKKGTYLNITLLDNKEGRDQFGNDGMVVQDIGKERREAGERGPILGNWKELDYGAPQRQQAPAPQPKPQQKPVVDDEPMDDIPF